MRTQTKEIQQSLTPEKAFEILKEGNRRFVSNLRLNRNLLQQVNETSDGQHPFAIILSCIDSRTSAELIFDQGLGDVFSVRIAGNVLNEDILGSMEFACHVAGAKLIVVLGHTRCGAVKGACGHVQLGHLTGLLGKIGPAVYEVEKRDGASLTPDDLVERVAVENTRHQMHGILDRSPILEHLYNEGKIGIVGGIYSVETGEVTFFDQQFHPPSGTAEVPEPVVASR
ncbi:MAG: carbonic anhydrase family protein [Vicinamibacterales bacterium]